MRAALLSGALVLASLAGCDRRQAASPATGSGGGDAARATAGQMPPRKAGLWLETLTRDGKPGRLGEMRMCVDAATDAKISLVGHRFARVPCGKTVSRRADGAYAFAATCKMGAEGMVISSGTASGDFTSSYKLHAQSDVTGSRFAPMNGRHVTDVEARYAGPCPADMTAGDIAFGPGIKVNINRLPAVAAGVFGG